MEEYIKTLKELQELTELFKERNAELDRRERWDKEMSELIRSILRTKETDKQTTR